MVSTMNTLHSVKSYTKQDLSVKTLMNPQLGIVTDVQNHSNKTRALKTNNAFMIIATVRPIIYESLRRIHLLS